MGLALLLRAATSDATGRQPYAVYLFSIIFVSLALSVGGLGIAGLAVADAAADIPVLGSMSCRLEIVPPARLTPPTRAAPRAAGTRPVRQPAGSGTLAQGRSTRPPPFTIEPIPLPSFSAAPLPELPRSTPAPAPLARTVCRSTAQPRETATRAAAVALAAMGVLAFHSRLAGRLIAEERAHG